MFWFVFIPPWRFNFFFLKRHGGDKRSPLIKQSKGWVNKTKLTKFNRIIFS